MTRALKASNGLDTTWMRQATCGRYTALPWTEDLRRVPDVIVEVMGDICDQCPVHQECANYAVQAQVTAGFWAGVNLNSHHDWCPPTADLWDNLWGWDEVA